MQAMILERTGPVTPGSRPLRMVQMPRPEPGPGQILLAVEVCGVCHTELDEIEGRTPPPHLPVILGHQVVGRVEYGGAGTGRFRPGDRVGVAWIYSACGACSYCKRGMENLCSGFRATGRDVHGGYAEWMVVHEDFAYPIPPDLASAEAAPLLCAGAIGYRSLRLAQPEDGQSLGLTGFGASAHLVLKLVRHQYPNTRVLVFARSERERSFALELGAVWAGQATDQPPELLDAIIDTTPVWKPPVEALLRLKPGGRLVINAIRKEEADKDYLLRLDYPQHLWMEKQIQSVANVTRADVQDFLALAGAIPIRPACQEFPLAAANQALTELRQGLIRGAKVLRITHPE